MRPMKSLAYSFLAITSFILTNLSLASAVKAVPFSEKELDPNSIIAIARPYGEGKYDLLVIEQLPRRRQCWQENGSNPIVVDPLLSQFDFTDSCLRSTDSNGYSLRVNGEDLGLDYLFRIVERDGEIWLVGTSRRDKTLPEMVVGRTYGIKAGLLKIILTPQWRITQRRYNNTLLSHFYFSTQQNLVSIPQNSSPSPADVAPDLPAQPVKEWTFTAGSSSSSNNNSYKNFDKSSYYRVIALIKTPEEQDKVKQMYPDSVPTSYDGVSAIQIGRFGNRSNAESIVESLKKEGLEGRIIP